MRPQRAVAYTMYVALYSAKLNTSVTPAYPYMLSDPIINVGDFVISKDDGAVANLATLPVASPAGSVFVKIALSATEMDADHVKVWGHDHRIQSGLPNPLWSDIAIDLRTTA